MEYEKSSFRIFEKMIENKRHWSRALADFGKALIALSLIFLITLVASQLAIGQMIQCIYRAFALYMDINEGNLYHNPRDALYMQKFTFDGIAIIEPRKIIEASNDTDSQAILTQEDAGVELHNRKQFYMLGDFANFNIVENLFEPTKNDPDYPYVNPARLAARQPPRSSASLKYIRNYSWFVINHTVLLSYKCYTSIMFFFTIRENSETVYILDILNTLKKFVFQEITIFSFDEQECTHTHLARTIVHKASSAMHHDFVDYAFCA